MGGYKAFKEWVESPMTGANGLSREEWAKFNKISRTDLEWAFQAGYAQGQYEALKEAGQVFQGEQV